MGVSVYWPLSVLCVFVFVYVSACVCLCEIISEYLQKTTLHVRPQSPPPFLLGEKVRLLPNFQYKFKVLLGKKRRGGVFEGEVDSPMHTMKLDALLYKPRIKVLRMISEGVGWSQKVMGGWGG